ncbi:alpha/beta hydrolase [Chelativorans sp.]|uniref:alpha/beta fold hydrolase n=1 Tax=Chelativorans sp. TaxID=2203393 RepID=UPI002811D88E|nr:alpha/beta hydrolase [Chelativorans sp.]
MVLKTIVLVQGAWGSSASWTPVAALLRGAGHVVHVPSLTGLGERRHLFSGSITLGTHVQDVVGAVESEGLERFVLVGHSYGGMVITGLADLMPDRIAGLVYLDAFLPENGQSVFDLIGPERTLLNLAQAGDAGGLGVPPPERHATRVPQDLRHYMTGRSPQPVGTMIERVRLSGGYRNVPRRHYVSAVIDQAPVFAQAYERVRSDPRWTSETIDTGHMVQLEKPAEVAGIIGRFAAESA